jgi:hypothetical protein
VLVTIATLMACCKLSFASASSLSCCSCVPEVCLHGCKVVCSSLLCECHCDMLHHRLTHSQSPCTGVAHVHSLWWTVAAYLSLGTSRLQRMQSDLLHAWCLGSASATPLCWRLLGSSCALLWHKLQR